MKLVIAIVYNRDRQRLYDALVGRDFRFTIISTTGGFLREGNTTVVIGVEEERKDALLGLIGEVCQTRERLVNVTPPAPEHIGAMVASPMKIQIGGAKVFVLPVEEHVEV